MPKEQRFVVNKSAGEFNSIQIKGESSGNKGRPQNPYHFYRYRISVQLGFIQD
jgi:hypothetical protein